MNNKKYDIAKAFKEFVSLRSDTDTFHEIKMQDFEYKKLKEYDYFKENETLVGKYKVNNINDRAVVWAMKKGKSEKTIILLHHHDAVDTCDYLEHEDLSHSPKELREKYLDLKWPDDIKKDLDDDRWVWGRGTADMKSGMTINHSILYDAIHLENLDYDGNILLISVPDEENLSAGMRQVPCLLNELKEKHKIEYDLLILTEPHSRVCADDITIHKGSVGKITPTILAKGVRCHIGDIYSGINPNLIMAEVIRNLELNIEFSDSFEDEFTPPPSIIFNRDLKETYDVSTPEFSAAYFNVLYLNRNLDRMFFDLKEILQWSFEDAINKVNYSYNEYLRKMGKESYVNCLSFIPTVLTVEEFEKKYVVGNKEREDKIEKVRKDISKAVEKKEMNLQNATIEIMKTLASFFETTQPLVLLGISPPFYPAVTNSMLKSDKHGCFKNIEKEFQEELERKNGVKSIYKNYFMGISDLSYTSVQDEKSNVFFIKNQLLEKSVYHIPFDEIRKIDIPVINLGPWGKDLHKKTERVYMPDVLENIPKAIKLLIEKM